jgi:hypothetical protein
MPSLKNRTSLRRIDSMARILSKKIANANFLLTLIEKYTNDVLCTLPPANSMPMLPTRLPRYVFSNLES